MFLYLIVRGALYAFVFAIYSAVILMVVAIYVIGYALIATIYLIALAVAAIRGHSERKRIEREQYERRLAAFNAKLRKMDLRPAPKAWPNHSHQAPGAARNGRGT